MQLQTPWIIDGANTTTLANDENSGLTAASPLLTDAERNRRTGWGQNTWPAGGAYHIRYISDIDEIWIEGTASPNTIRFWHGSMTDNAGQTVLYTGVINAITALNRAAAVGGQPILVTSNALPVSWTASALIGKRMRRTSDNATSFAIKDLGVKQARTFEWTVGGNYSIPFTEPSSAATPNLNDQFVVETLTKINKVNINSRGGRGTLAGNFYFANVFDSLDIGNDYVVGTDSANSWMTCGCIYRGNNVLNSFFNNIDFNGTLQTVSSGSTFTSARANRTIYNGGGGNVGTMNFQPVYIGQFNRFMVQGGRVVTTSLPAGDIGGLQPGQLGIFDCPSGDALTCKSVQGFWMSNNTAIVWGTGNVAFAVNLRTFAQLLLNVGPFSAANFNIVGASGDCEFGQGRAAIPAFDNVTNTYTAARTLSFANIFATVATGGFCQAAIGFPGILDPVTGCGICTNP